jgi:large subunit ribosomal protein L22
MRAKVTSVRLAPKKANLIATMVRRKSVPEAMDLLAHTSKKAARIFEKLLRSAIANASHNDKQDPQTMIIKTVMVNKGQVLRRGVPMARGRVRPINKFLCHIEMELGYAEQKTQKATAPSNKEPKVSAKKSPVKKSSSSHS